MLTLLGRDYRAPYAYFKLFYEGIRLAIESGARTLRGGSGAYDLKRRLGFKPQANNYVTFAAVSPALARLAQWATTH
jgi:hypothetical protein